MFIRYFAFQSFIIIFANFCCLICCLEYKYHENKDLEGIMKGFIKKQPLLLSEIYSIGETRKGNQLWVLKITAANASTIGTPNIKLIGNLYGNEPIGREILLHFADHLISNYGKDQRISWLLNNTNIYILPSLNPDGFDKAIKIFCYNEDKTGKTVPPRNVDLNKNFPDFFHDNSNVIEKTTIESNAIMKWMENHTFTLSADLHGGALVANYPFYVQKTPKFQKEAALTPDNDVFEHLANTYAKNHPKMHLENPCPESVVKSKGGIVNGAERYGFEGTMNDYNYAFHGCMEVTLDISCCNYPPERDLPDLWEQNKEALLSYCMQAHRGVSGQIVDYDSKLPITNANLTIDGRNMTFWSTKNTGEFWRILLPGHYKIKVEAKGYNTQNVPFDVLDYKNKYPKLHSLQIELQNSSIYTTTTERTTTQQSTSRIVKANTPKLSPRNGHMEVEKQGNETTEPTITSNVQMLVSGTNNILFVSNILFHFPLALLLRT